VSCFIGHSVVSFEARLLLTVYSATGRPIQVRCYRVYRCIVRRQRGIVDPVTGHLPSWTSALVFENTYFTFFKISKNVTFFRFWNDMSKSRKKSLAKSVILNPSKWVHVLRSVISVNHFSYFFVSLVYLRTYRHLSHTVLSCIVSRKCEHYTPAFLSKDVWCWWLTGTDFR